MLQLLRKLLPENIFLRRWYSALNGFLAALFYGFPAKSLTCIGITGTDGKTTTTEMVAHVLRSNNKKVLSISTVATMCGDNILETDKRTTPSPWILQKLLKKAKQEKMEFAVIEVSSHALAQKRVFGVSFSAAVLTNITPEHLDYHGSFEEYANAKKLLFTKYLTKNGVAILNDDDDCGKSWTKEFLEKLRITNQSIANSKGTILRVQEKRNILTYSTSSTANSLSHSEVSFLSEGMETLLVAEDSSSAALFLPVFGEFNIQNAMAAIQVARFFGISLESATESFSTFSGVSGRMEPISAGQNFFVFVDFAITPGSLENLLTTAKKMTPQGKVFLVFGSCGTHPNVDIRKSMGEAAVKGADVVIITDDEPYYEEPAQIRSHILSGAQSVVSDTKTAQIHEIEDRKQAMEFACRHAKKGDVVIVSGMGHLNSRNIGGEEREWNDGEVMKEVLKKGTRHRAPTDTF